MNLRIDTPSKKVWGLFSVDSVRIQNDIPDSWNKVLGRANGALYALLADQNVLLGILAQLVRAADS